MIWIDIDNPPQVQYLLPFKRAFEHLGHEVVVTARDYSITFNLLRQRGVEFVPCGRAFGKNKLRKVWGTVARAQALRAQVASHKPCCVISASRSSALAALLMGIPAFIFCDYEFAELGSFRLLRSHLVFPEVIGQQTFLDLGFTREHLIPYRGIKEDLSFSGIDFERVQPHRFELQQSDKILIVFRPPAVETHYYNSDSGNLAGEVLKYLAGQTNVIVVFFPRYASQASALDAQSWSNPPIVLSDGIEFVSLLKAVDAVVTSGGTMAREAAYLDIPALSIFKGKKGAVDKHLESMGKLTFIEKTSQLSGLKFQQKTREKKVVNNPNVLNEVVTEILKRCKNVD